MFKFPLLLQPTGFPTTEGLGFVVASYEFTTRDDQILQTRLFEPEHFTDLVAVDIDDTRAMLALTHNLRANSLSTRSNMLEELLIKAKEQHWLSPQDWLLSKAGSMDWNAMMDHAIAQMTYCPDRLRSRR